MLVTVSGTSVLHEGKIQCRYVYFQPMVDMSVRVDNLTDGFLLIEGLVKRATEVETRVVMSVKMKLIVGHNHLMRS